MSPTSCRCSTPRPPILRASSICVKSTPPARSIGLALADLATRLLISAARTERLAPHVDGDRPPTVDHAVVAVPRAADHPVADVVVRQLRGPGEVHGGRRHDPIAELGRVAPDEHREHLVRDTTDWPA